MDEHRKFLADRLLTEERPVTYRLLSRALDVHVNTAKEMLYDFHKYQNGLKAHSIHATYLISGIKATDNKQADGDVEMASSMPEEECLSESVVTHTITLAREEELTNVLAGYRKVTSLHMYSLAPHPQKDLTLLCDVTAQLSEYSKTTDPTSAARKYGIILNSQVRKRDRKGHAPAPVQSSAKPIKQEAPKPTPAAKVKQDADAPKPSPFAPKLKTETSDSSSKDATPTSSNNAKKPAPLNRGASGGIMAAFASAAAKPPRPKPAKKENTAMALSDDGEADDDDMPVSKKPPVDTEAVRRAKQEREEELRKMMEEDAEEEEEPSEKEEEPEDEEMEEAPEPEPEPEAELKKQEPAEMVSSAGDGRRRGKRRVMKKKRILDDQGYMVTIQEPGWESFSEDEAPPAKKATLTPTSTPSSSASKAKKPAGKGGQGSIMSFFGKK